MADHPPIHRAGGEAASASVIGVILVVAVTIVSAAGAYIWLSGFNGDQDPLPVIGFHATAENCHARLMVSSVEGADWRQLLIRVQGASQYGISAAGQLVADADWRGSLLPSSDGIEAGESVRVALRERLQQITVTILHERSGTIVYQNELRAPDPDSAPASASSLPEGSVVSNMATISGIASDDCSGVGRVRVAVQRASDGLYLSQSGFVGQQSYFSTHGGQWSVALPDQHLTVGQYRIITVPADTAGNEGATGTVNITYATTPPVQDPGHAYEDVDNDERFTLGLDVAIPNADILDGLYKVQTPSRGLVIPPGVGPVTMGPTGRIEFESGSGGHLVVLVNLTAGKEIDLEGGTKIKVPGIRVESASDKVKLDSEGRVEADGLWLKAWKLVTVDAKGGISLNGSTINATTGKIDLKVSGSAGDVHLLDAVLYAWGDVDLDAKGDLWADGARMTSIDDVDLDADRGDSGRILLRNANLAARNEIDLDAKGDILASGASLRSNEKNLDLKVSGSAGIVDVSGGVLYAYTEVKADAKADLLANGTTVTAFTDKIDMDAHIGGAGSSYFALATLSAYKDVDLDAKDALLADNARLTSTTGKVDLDAEGMHASLAGATLQGYTNVEVTAKTSLTATNAYMNATTQQIDLDANGGGATLTGAQLRAYNDVKVDSQGDIDVEGALLRATTGKIELDANSAPRTIRVQGSIFDDLNDAAKAKPAGVTISGVPASGAINASG